MSILLYPLSLVYGLVMWIRNRLFDFGFLQSEEFPIPIISVGNITVGGTGKTPHVEYLINLLRDKYKICVVSRGYKRYTSGIYEVKNDSSFLAVGDEPKQIKQKFPDVCVIVSESRAKAINKILSGQIGNQPDVIILDDAYQHRWVKPGFSILLIDFHRPIYEDSLLPYGMLREAESEKMRADMVIVTKTPKKVNPIDRRIISKNLNLYPHQTLLYSTFQYGNPKAVFPEIGSLTFDLCRKNKFSAILVTGIANPVPLREFLGDIFVEVEHLKFPDHHSFTTRDLQRIFSAFEKIESSNKIILTTEKDAVRLQELMMEEKATGLPMFYVPIEVHFLDDAKEVFEKKIVSYIIKDRRKFE